MRKVRPKRTYLIKADSYLKATHPTGRYRGPPTCSDTSNKCCWVNEALGSFSMIAALWVGASHVLQPGQPQIWRGLVALLAILVRTEILTSICFLIWKGVQIAWFSVGFYYQTQPIKTKFLGCMNMLLSVLREIIVGPWNG